MAKHEVNVQMFYSGQWKTVAAYTRTPIVITEGRQDEASNLTPGSCTLTLDNRDGSKNPRNPMSPLYGLIGRNTPLRIQVPEDDTPGYLMLLLDLQTQTAAKVSTPDHASLDITGDIDVRVDVAYNNWTESGLDDGPFLAGKWYTVTANRSWRFYLNIDGTLEFEWSTLGTSGSVLTKTSTASVSPRMGERMAFRVTLDVDNGAAGNTVTFYTADTIDGPWTQLGAPVVTAGVTSIFASATAPLELGHLINSGFADPDGRLYAAEVRNGINGTPVADPDWRDRETGGSFTDDAGRVWSETGNTAFVPPDIRFSGEIAVWQPRRTMDFDPDTGKGDAWVEIEANGILRRKNAGSKPLRSALTRAIQNGPRGAFGISSAAIAHWPLEDEAGSTSGASIIPGIAEMTGQGTLTWSELDPVPGGAPIVKVGTSSGRLVGFIPLNAYPAGWVNTDGTAATFIVSYADETAGAAIFNAAFEDDQGNTWYIYGTLSGTTDMIQAFQRWPTASPGPGHIGTSPTTFTPSDDTYFQITMILSQSGADVSAQVLWYGNDGSIQTAEGGTVAGVTLGRIKKVQLRAGSALNNLAFGHVAVIPTSTVDITGLLDAARGHPGESVHNRLTRLCAEEGLVLRWRGSTQTGAMGIQQIAKFPELLNHGESVDRGLLSETRELLGLGYYPLRGLYNQSPVLTLDYSQAGIGAPFDPNLDDQRTRNEVTASRAGGSSAVAAQTTGPMSTAEPEDGGVGLYDESVTVYAHTDEQLPGIASWLVHLGTEEETRWPQVTVDLDAAALDHTSALDAPIVDVGDVIVLDNMPTDLSFNALSLLVLGYVEVIESHRRTITFNCVPAAPYDVATTATAGSSTTQPKVGHNRTTLNEDLTLVETLADIVVEAGSALWTTSGVDFDIVIGGERMTVTSVTDLTATTQRFTCVRSVNGVQKTHSAGDQIKLFKPAIVAL